MPSQFDDSYHNTFRKPSYDDEASKKWHQLKKEADEVFELRPAPVPKPEMEVEYIDWLQEDFKSDPWLTPRFRKFTANPKRTPWKNQRRMKRTYQYTFTVNWILGSAITWPIAAYIGRCWKTTAGGVAHVPVQRWVHDFPKPEPGRVARLRFRWYAFGSSALMGFLFARHYTDEGVRTGNQWYNRPDLKPKAAMVDTQESIMERTMKKDQYMVLKKEGEGKRSPIYRFFFARDADFTVKENPYANAHREDVWNHKEAMYSDYGNDFRDHHN